MKEAVPSPAKPPKKRRRWLRRSILLLLGLVVLTAAFHRPLVRLAVIRIAARQHLTVDFHFSGTVFTNLTLRDVRAVPNGTGPTPVEQIAIGTMRFEYSLPMLARYGLGEFLRSYEIRHADLNFVALPSKSASERKEKINIAEQINTIIAQPAAYADRAEIEDFTVRVRSPETETIIEGVDVLLAPDQPGYIRLKAVKIPGLPEWRNLHAITSYEKRNLFIKDLELAPQLVLRNVNWDASQRAQGKSNVSLEASVFGGGLSLAINSERLAGQGENLSHSYDSRTHLEAQAIDLRALAEYFGKKNFPVTTLRAFSTDFHGEPEKPRTWSGNTSAIVEGIGAGPLKIERVEFESGSQNGFAKATASASIAGNAFKVAATAQLPATVNDFQATEGSATVELDGSHLAELGEELGLREPMSGSAAVEGRIALRERIASANLNISAEGVSGNPIAVESAQIKLTARKVLTQPRFDGLTVQANADLSKLRYAEMALDTLHLDGSLKDRFFNVQKLVVNRGANTLDAHGTYQLPLDFADAAKAPLDAQFSIEAPDLAEFGLAVKKQAISGHLNGAGTLKLVDGKLAGGVKVAGGDLKLGEFALQSLAGKVAVADGLAKIEELALNIDGSNSIALNGNVGVEKPFSYNGALHITMKDLAVIEPLLAVFGVNQSLGGRLNVEIAGDGSIDPAQHNGELKLALEKAHYGKITLSEVRLAGIYGAEFTKSSEFLVVTDHTRLTGTIDYGEGKLRLRDLDLHQADLPVLTGYIILPFDPGNREHPIPLAGRIAANVNATELNLETLFASFGKAMPIKGKLTANLVSGGTLLNPTLHLKLAAHSLVAKAAPRFDDAAVDLTLHYSNKELTLDGTARQKTIQPLIVKGRIPLDLEKAIKEKRYDAEQPIDLTASVAPTSLAIVPTFVPAVRRIDGTAGFDLRATGTLGKPDVKLGLNIDVKSARLAKDNIPAIGSFQAKLGLVNGVLSFNTFRGEIGGGVFKVGGNISFPELNELSFGEQARIPKAIEPVFDLRLESKEVLIVRNDTITARADADLRLDGPLKAATASGTVYVVHSRFFKEVDILPISLPGRPRLAHKAAPKTAPKEVSFSFPNPPLRDWKFDIAIKTREDDPFRVRGNLATGAVALDLQFGGTGLQPWLEGSARIDHFVANLPFSRLSVTRGFVLFKQDTPFVPTLDIQAESRVGDHLVNAYIYGTTNDPQVQLSSEPPLPHADIVSLLATGSTTQDMGKNAEVLASRAAILAAKQLYRKVFKRNSAPPSIAEEKTGAGDLRERFEFDLGATDNQTGRQEFAGRFRINDRLYLVGEADVDGQFTGRLKYLIRFR
jgi:hypothetical protein